MVRQGSPGYGRLRSTTVRLVRFGSVGSGEDYGPVSWAARLGTWFVETRLALALFGTLRQGEDPGLVKVWHVSFRYGWAG